jgi:hypothetical protein
MFDHAKIIINPSSEETLQSYDDSYESSESSGYGAYGSVNSHEEASLFDRALIGGSCGSLDKELTTLELGSMLEFVPTMYDPACFTIIDPKLLKMACVDVIPHDMLRMLVADYITVAETFGIHWTELVRYDPPTSIEKPVDIEEFELEEVVLQDSNKTSEVVLSCFNEVEVNMNTSDLFDFADDTSFKRLPVTGRYDMKAVCGIILGQGMQVSVDVENSELVFFPEWSKIPANFQAIEESLESGRLPPDLQKFLIALSLEGSINFKFGDLLVPLSDTRVPELLPEPPGEGLFSGARLDIPEVPKPTSVRSRRGGTRESKGNLSRGATGFHRFLEEVEDLRIDFDPDDYVLESEDLNELMAEEPTAMAVNGVLSKGRITNMSAKVTRYLQRTGKFFLSGEERYINMFKLLSVSGAFNCLKRKLEDPYSFIVAMKVWLFRTAIVEAPYHSKIEFITI